MTRFLSGIDQDMEQRRREWLLDVDRKQVRDAAERLNAAVKDSSVALIGPRKDFAKESDGWKVEDMGMGAPEAVADT